MDDCKIAKGDNNASVVEMVNPDDGSTLKNAITISGETFSIKLLDSAIEEARRKLDTLSTVMDSVANLMSEVNCENKAALQAVEEAGQSSLDILANVDALKQEQQRLEEANVMLARDVCAKKADFAAEMNKLQPFVSHLLKDEDGCIADADEMRRFLEMRLSSALTEKELAVTKNLEKEASCREAFACQEKHLAEAVEESKRLRLEATDICKVLDFLKDRRNVLNTLSSEISDTDCTVQVLKLLTQTLRRGNTF